MAIDECHRPIRQGAHVRLDRCWSELEKESDRLGHRCKAHEVQGDHFKATRIARPGGIVVQELGEITSGRLRHPADLDRLQLLDEPGTHVREPGTPRRHQPLLAARRQDVDMHGRQIERTRTDALDAVDDEIDATRLARRTDAREINSIATPKAHPRERHDLHPGVGFDRVNDRVLVRVIARHRHQPILGALRLRHREPGIHIRGKLAV